MYQVIPRGLGFVIKLRSPWLELLPEAAEALWDVLPPLSGHRKSNHFLNGPPDAEERLISPPRGPLSPPGGQMAQLGKNLGHFILYQEDLPGALVRSALTTRLEVCGHLAWRCGVCGGVGGEATEYLSKAVSTLPPWPPLSLGKCKDSVSFLSNK